MYTKDSFENYPIFKNIIKKYGKVNLLDPLTKTILRGHMMTYVDDLIREKKPFSLIIIDIDNFKQINDNYGHQVGDEILKITADNIIEAVGDCGLVGRYGGDEFIIVDIVHNDYDSMHLFLETIYMGATRNLPCGTVFRKDLAVGSVKIFVSGTIGAANFPNDADNYDDLFNKADKALYRGKMKGRNCFIIYVHEKHKDIDISKLIKEPIQNTLFNLSALFDKDCPINEKIISVIDYIKKLLKITAVYLFDENGSCFFGDDYNVGDLSSFIDENDMAAYNNINEIYGNDKKFDKFIDDYNLFSVLIGRIMFKGKCYGYIIFSDSAVQRIWQNEDMALMYFTIKLIGSEIVFNKLGLK